MLQEVKNPPVCVTLHPGFRPVCLERWSLRLAAGKYKTKDKRRYSQAGSEEAVFETWAFERHGGVLGEGCVGLGWGRLIRVPGAVSGTSTTCILLRALHFWIASCLGCLTSIVFIGAGLLKFSSCAAMGSVPFLLCYKEGLIYLFHIIYFGKKKKLTEKQNG